MSFDFEEQFARVTTKYPDAVILCKPDAKLQYGGFTIAYTLDLPKEQFNRERTWIAFDVPPGFPAAHPRDFFTDPELRLASMSFIGRNSWFVHPLLGEAKQKWGTFEASWDLNAQIIHGYVQMWNPNQSSLYTYAMVIKHALESIGWRGQQ